MEVVAALAASQKVLQQVEHLRIPLGPPAPLLLQLSRPFPVLVDPGYLPLRDSEAQIRSIPLPISPRFSRRMFSFGRIPLTVRNGNSILS